MNKYTFLIIAVLSGITISLLRSRQRLIEERDSYKSNTEALMSEVRRIQADSSTMALDIKTLTMSLDEYKDMVSVLMSSAIVEESACIRRTSKH